MAAKIRDRIKISKLAMEIIQGNNVKLVVFRTDRSDIPHLTISCGNISKEIDVHLKSRSLGGKEDHRTIAKIPESDLSKLYKVFEPEFLQSMWAGMQKIRTARPGWLGRKGYIVLYLSDEVRQQIASRIAPKQKHKRKWTHVVDEQAIKDILQSQEIMDSVYHPAILHELAAQGYTGP